VLERQWEQLLGGEKANAGGGGAAVVGEIFARERTRCCARKVRRRCSIRWCGRLGFRREASEIVLLLAHATIVRALANGNRRRG